MEKDAGSNSKAHLLQKETIESDDLLFNPGWFPSAEKTIFSLNDDGKKHAVEDSNVINFVTFSADLKVLNHSRAIYNVLDFLGDIGGLSDALKLIASFFVSVFC